MSTTTKAGTHALSLSAVSRNFGGIRAVADISFDVSHGKRLTIIGTNGAGKSTLFNLITGVYPLSSGSISVFGEDVSKQPAYSRAKLGIARTFQTSKLFQGLTVRENLYTSLRQALGEKKISWLANPSQSDQLHDESTSILERVDLLKKSDILVSDISHGESRQLEVAMALAMRPKVLMLDEPAAGISPTERGRLVDLLKSLDKEMTLVLIEHDMAVALAVADEVIVMHDGTMFMQGSPDEVRNSSAVRDLYLGSNHE
jgi:branched-chain amino acid transport system ATP-binding protein